MQKISKYLYYIVCFVMFLFMDLTASNYLAAHHHQLGWNNPVFELTYIKNTGAAFNLLNNSTELLIILSAAALTLLCVYIVRHIKGIKMLELFYIAILSAGIAGNMHERIIYGFVRDFFRLNFVNFPVFNISDVLINIGVIFLIVIIILKKSK